jgi:hypothetical protein
LWPLRLLVDHVLARGHRVLTGFATGPKAAPIILSSSKSAGE